MQAPPPFVIYALAFNLSVNLILGLALWLAWSRERSQGFNRLLGASFLAQGLATPAYLLWRQGEGLIHSLGGLGLAASGALSMLMMVAGLRDLVGRPLSWRQATVLGLGLLGLLGALLDQSIAVAQGSGATLNTLLGLAALRWLWPHGKAERLAGLSLVLIGLNQFNFALGGEAALGLQSSIGAALRMLLGISLLHAALRRSSLESRGLRTQLHYMTEHSHQGVLVAREDEPLYANAALLELYGVASLAEFKRYQQQQPASLRAAALQRRRAIISGELPHAHWEGERRRSDGSLMRLMFSSWRIDWADGPAEHLVISDDTERYNATQALLHQATHDPVTGLPNRSALQQRLRELCAEGRPFGLIWLDLDRFTLLNEAYGHATGDALLREFGALLQAEFAPQAQTMHLGEDEFALLVTAGAEPALLHELTRRLRARLARPFAVDAREIYIDASIGVARFPHTAGDPEGLLREASAAMHEAKQEPGSAERWADEASSRRSSSATMLAEQAMRAGLKNAEFELVYQPKIAAAGGALLSFEALVRWHRPGHGVVSPADFIPAAERTGLIVPLGAMLLQQACRQLRDWRADGRLVLPVAVNVSPLQLHDPSFPAFVARTLQAFDLPAALLTLEITETAAVRDADQARERISRLNELGIKVALDDFGTGFSSLNLLRSMPLDAVKIDRSLIEPMPQRTASAVVRAICQLAAVLDLKVVAEGIETQAQAEAARAAGCNELQGFLFSKPLSAAAAGDWLARQAEPALG
ncbi:putative bifunctional diguanylate cyclase/phosphodiesterase [Paucibacter sp. XJ19-41]|uniref:putative bifunctional diguanylate cyclase/phosphodiesterase n=1 Tax=Paucibacter sp. XJ19-41 TaxID=2927824 RepID=UPI00234BDD13|nr:EAL domain-containing protein [Paucibacter sp. XJ19-41]MDC6169038.1 EAL domain-containing protein [Paucibacter sp. XJ19-41]